MRTTALVLTVVVGLAVVPSAAVAQSSGGECSFPVERTDATGTDVRLTAEPESVVTLNPSAAQTIWEIGAQEKVVGVTKHASNLEGAESKTNISSNGQTINNEEVAGLEPDLVLAPNVVENETVETLRGAGQTVYRFREAKSIDDIKRKTRLVGAYLGACEGASDTVDWMESRLATVDAAVADADRPDTLYAFYDFTSGEGTFIDTMLERAGGNNVAADAGLSGYKQINDEILVQQDPDWIVLNDDWDEIPDSAAYQSTTAVQNDQIVVVNKNHLNRPGPRVVYAVTALAESFHPESYAVANSTATTNTSANETASTTETPDEVGPGFGALVALVALVATVVVACVRR